MNHVLSCLNDTGRYVAPERLNNEGFVQTISHTKVRLIAIDEAHCISEWGHAFRPDYLKGNTDEEAILVCPDWKAVARFAKEIQAERVLCLTATATAKVADDICAAFNIDSLGVFRTTTYRPNLRLLAQSFTLGAGKVAALKAFLKKHKGPSIVYVQTHDQTDEVSTFLKQDGLNSYSYHAGMANDVRTAVQDQFMKSDNVVVRTPYLLRDVSA